MSAQTEVTPAALNRLAPPTAQGAAGPALIRKVLGRVWSAIRSRKILLALCCLASVAAAVAAAKHLGKQTWEAESTLLFAPLPIGEDGKGLYQTPELKTLTALVNSPQNIETIRKEFQVVVPAKAIDKNLTVTIPNGTKIVQLKLRWDDGPKTTAMLNRLVDVFISQVADLRRAKMKDHLTDYEVSLAKVQERHAAASTAVRAFHQRERIADFKEEIIAVNKRISDLTELLAQHHRTEADIIAQKKRMDRHMAEVKADQEKASKDEKDQEASNESVSDARRRQDRLRELITDERRIQEVQALLDAKRREYERARKLAARNAVSPAELEAIQAEMAALTAKIQDGEKIQKWQKELETIDKVVVPTGGKKNAGSPIIQQVLFRILELELQHTAVREELSQIERGIVENHEKLERLDTLRGQYDSLMQAVETIDVERRQLEAQIGWMRNFETLKGAEFAVATRAETAPDPASSNKKILLAEFGGGGIFVSFALVLALELLGARWTSELAAEKIGLPLIGRVSAKGHPLRTQQLRALALRLRQYLPEPGTVVVFSSLSEPGRVDETIDELASFLALRDERVLILDTRLAVHAVAVAGPVGVFPDERSDELGLPPRGLSDYLTFAINDIDEICHPAEGFGVDRLPPGEAEVPADAFATHRMSDLLAELRQRYSILLMVAPSLAHSVDLQILTALAQGFVAVVDVPGRVGPEVRRTLSDLLELGAPVLGQLVFGSPSR